MSKMTADRRGGDRRCSQRREGAAAYTGPERRRADRRSGLDRRAAPRTEE